MESSISLVSSIALALSGVVMPARLATRRVLVLAFCQSFGGLSPKLRPCIVGLPTIVSVRSVEVALDVRESGTAAQPVKSETFSDEWHVRVYSHAARSSSRSSLFEEDRLTTADSGQRSRRIGHLSRVFPPRDVLSSLVENADVIEECAKCEKGP